MSQLAGRTYDGNGPHREEWDSVGTDLDGLFHSVWRHDLDAEFEAALALLREREAFSADASP